MKYLSVVCDILERIDKSMDFEEFDYETLSEENLGLSPTRYNFIMGELVKNRYIGGVKMIKREGYHATPYARLERPYITLKGAEFYETHLARKKRK